ncbi:MAG: hypothetical protein AAF141_14895, partial [Pseudomonadota bacterium]
PAPSPDAEPRERREWRNQQEGLRAAMSAINTMVAIAETQGSGAERVDSWEINIPEARGQMLEINGIEMRVPDFLGMVMPLAMGGLLR